MKVAFACWQHRIAPVFDTARLLHLIEVAGCEVAAEQDAVLPNELPLARVLRLVELEVGFLVCGAISRPLQELVGAYGIEVIPFVAGNLEDVVPAYLAGDLRRGAFAMPGCCGRGRGRRRRRAGHGPEQGKVRPCQAAIEPGHEEKDH
jgi:predicted Fe-Mo cluster-binding NifX family protein